MDSRTSDFACQRVTHYPMINLTKKHMLTFLCANLLHDIETALVNEDNQSELVFGREPYPHKRENHVIETRW